LKDEQFRVLVGLSEVSGHMDLKGFAEKAGLSPSEALHEIQELAKDGFLQRVGSGYGITQKGKAALKVFTPAAEGKGFRFYFGIDRPSEFATESLGDFYKIIRQIDVESIEFHLYRGDFQNWLQQVFAEPELTADFNRIKDEDLKGEALREALLGVLDRKYGVRSLL
jgi:DNA-binding Lrp family transcriptional regulator